MKNLDAKEAKQDETAKSPSPRPPTDSGADTADHEGVTVSEEYQKKAHAVTHKASKHEINHLRGKLNDREDSIRQEEIAARSGSRGQNPPPSEFSVADGPTELKD